MGLDCTGTAYISGEVLLAKVQLGTIGDLEILLGYFQSIATYLFNTCHISILNDVARELRGKRRKVYLEKDTI
jgi:hypothetical protein